jgi:hypothetical protein
MKWIVYAAITSALVAGGLWASTSRQSTAPAQQEDELEEFVPTEKVPADSSVAFPVDI